MPVSLKSRKRKRWSGSNATILELTSRGESSRRTGSGEEGKDDGCEKLHGMVLLWG
jgi:hypothetical protein